MSTCCVLCSMLMMMMRSLELVDVIFSMNTGSVQLLLTLRGQDWLLKTFHHTIL